MKRFALIIMTIATIFAQQVYAQYYSVNFDAKTVAAMVAAYGTGTVAEAYYDEQVQNILKHYKASEVATAGIFASKFLEGRHSLIWASGAVPPKITTTAGFITWWRTRLSRRHGLSPN